MNNHGKDKMIPLFLIDHKNELIIFTVDSLAKPVDGDTLISFLPKESNE